MIAIEPSIEESIVASIDMMQQLPMSDVLMTLIAPRALACSLLAAAALFCESFAKWSFGLMIVERCRRTNVERLVSPAHRLWSSAPPVLFAIEWLRLAFGLERRADIVAGRRVVQVHKSISAAFASDAFVVSTAKQIRL
jgi:hypothetical protein